MSKRQRNKRRVKSTSTKRRLIAYLRRSTDVQDDLSYDRQLSLCEQWCERNDAEIIAVHQEQISGASPARPIFDSIIEDLRTGNDADGIIVAEHDRLTRARPIEAVNLIDELEQDHAKQVWSVDKGLLSAKDFTSLLQLFIFAHNAHEFVLKQALRMHDASWRWAKDGRVCGPGVSYGYIRHAGDKHDPDRGKLKLDKQKAKVVRQIFDWCLSGMRPSEIARCLTDQGIPSPRAGTMLKKGKSAGRKCRPSWGYQTVKNILMNQRYVGTMTWGLNQSYHTDKAGKRKSYIEVEARQEPVCVPNAHDAIVTAVEFEMVQELLTEWSTSKSRATESPSACKSLLQCPCGEPLIVYQQSQSPWRWYRCQSIAKSCPCEYRVKVREDNAIDVLINALETFFNSSELQQKYVSLKRSQLLGNETGSDDFESIQKQIAVAESELAKLDESEMRAIDLGKEHLLPKYQERRDGLEGKLQRLRRTADRLSKSGDINEMLDEFAARYSKQRFSLADIRELDAESINKALRSKIKYATVWTEFGQLPKKNGRPGRTAQVISRGKMVLSELSHDDKKWCQFLSNEQVCEIEFDANGIQNVRYVAAA